ncbi:hypothetical protein ANCDUO_05976 [Ancylostoma duodenale]|uniref:7TM GPCR serpentine receptor class x (Srx) domain-containing protein n=1 Tax=Ancylostoma duodenale TaxID=51022 RepID=A0A0C2GQZ6_9BILA|nr:hypothetical protein ANCDUO_05976 [Ancylostoma duodenale]
MRDESMGLPTLDQERKLAAIIIFAISLVGVCANSLVAMFTRRLVTMNNPFGRLTASQSTGEAVLCVIFAFYYSPMVYL